MTNELLTVSMIGMIMIDWGQAGVEYNHVKGVMFEWLCTVSYGSEIFAVAVEPFGPFPVS